MKNLSKMLAALMVATMSMTLAPMATASHISDGCPSDLTGFVTLDRPDARPSLSTPTASPYLWKGYLDMTTGEDVPAVLSIAQDPDTIKAGNVADIRVTIFSLDETQNPDVCSDAPAHQALPGAFNLAHGVKYYIYVEDVVTDDGTGGANAAEDFALTVASA